MNSKNVIFVLAALALGSVNLGAADILGRITCEGKPVAGVAVSDGDTIVYSGSDGRYSMECAVTAEQVFITTPSGYRALGTDPLRPGFWQYVHPGRLQDEIHDFSLVREDQSRYSILFLPDVHLANDPDRDDINRFKTLCYPRIKEGVAEASRKGAVYTVNLGDFTHDIYWYEFGFDESDAFRMFQDLDYPCPIYGVMGNHDHDPAVVGQNVDSISGRRCRDVWGPDRYSVNIGKDHWVFLDNLCYVNVEGKGKKGPGVKGDRSYRDELSESQMAWLRKDLAAVASGTRVYVCCHCPVLIRRKDVEMIPRRQVAVLDSLGARFKDGITVYSGHIHRWELIDSPKYPNLHQRSLPAASGIMWETWSECPLVSGDGSDAGVMLASYPQGQAPSYDFLTYTGGNQMLRVYDMNEVGKVYRSNALCRMQRERFPDYSPWYGDEKYRDYVYVNFWEAFPGDRLEVIENGKVLQDEKRRDCDPVKNFAYELRIYAGTLKRHNPHSRDICRSMHEYKTSSATSPVTVRVLDRDGRVKFEKTYRRPIDFMFK